MWNAKGSPKNQLWRKKLGHQAAGLFWQSWLERVNFVSLVSALLCSRVKVLGNRVWLAECRSCAQPLAVAGLGGRISRRSLQNISLDSWVRGRHMNFTKTFAVCENDYPGGNQGAAGKWEWGLSIETCQCSPLRAKKVILRAQEAMHLLSWYVLISFPIFQLLDCFLPPSPRPQQIALNINI